MRFIVAMVLAHALCAHAAVAQSSARSAYLNERLSLHLPGPVFSRTVGPCEALSPVVSGIAGTILGAFVGYRIDRAISPSGEDPGLTGLLLGAVVGAVGGAMVGSTACDSSEEDRMRNESELQRLRPIHPAAVACGRNNYMLTPVAPSLMAHLQDVSQPAEMWSFISYRGVDESRTTDSDHVCPSHSRRQIR